LRQLEGFTPENKLPQGGTTEIFVSRWKTIQLAFFTNDRFNHQGEMFLARSGYRGKQLLI